MLRPPAEALAGMEFTHDYLGKPTLFSRLSKILVFRRNTQVS